MLNLRFQEKFHKKHTCRLKSVLRLDSVINSGSQFSDFILEVTFFNISSYEYFLPKLVDISVYNGVKIL